MTLSDLPAIQISRNKRSTRLRLRVTAQHIKLTAPVFCSHRQIQDFLTQSEQWLIETWQQQQEKTAQVDRTLPIALRLFNLDEAVKIIYQKQKQCYVFDRENHQLCISDRQPASYLKAFVMAYAQHDLAIYLTQLSAEVGLRFAGCSIRQPKTRWGSCSAKHDIMLNSALALLEENAARYVCIHELAHTQHFNHSPAFWAEVAKHDPNYKNHRKILKNTLMPWWW